MSTHRKASYKSPPTNLTDKLVSQEARRCKALEEQKRRRAEKFDSSRQLDFFADLNLGRSDDEEDTTNDDILEIVKQGSVPLSALLSDNVDSIVSSNQVQSTSQGRTGKKKKHRVKKGNGRSYKPNRWADTCMYAELLEMVDDTSWSRSGRDTEKDGLPEDLESGWVVVAPVPVGKRCLAVTYQSGGFSGVVPNTTLRSRVLGKSLIPPFPSSLPPLTILDCILDANWRNNGILHILDVLKWKGQDVGDCETPFRFWWRDTRLAELPQSIPPSHRTLVPSAVLTSPLVPGEQLQYPFPYPVTFIPVPYHTNTTLSFLASQIIPLARSARSIPINIPKVSSVRAEAIMDVDSSQVASSSTFSGNPVPFITISAEVVPDGLLLYVAQASYEPGTSPLSSWVPISVNEATSMQEGPLDLFERLVKRRLELMLNPDAISMDLNL